MASESLLCSYIDIYIDIYIPDGINPPELAGPGFESQRSEVSESKWRDQVVAGAG